MAFFEKTQIDPNTEKGAPDQCCTFVSRIQGGWEHTQWNTKWKLTSLQIFGSACLFSFVALDEILWSHYWFSHCSSRLTFPCLTALLDCLSPNPDRRKAQIPACNSNTTQPVEDNDFFFYSTESHLEISYFTLQVELGTAWPQMFC